MRREPEVLALVANGEPTSAMSQRLGISENPALSQAPGRFVERYAAKRLMGFEPTTFCMASRGCVRGAAAFCALPSAFYGDLGAAWPSVPARLTQWIAVKWHGFCQ
jgi:hypothetical protein